MELTNLVIARLMKSLQLAGCSLYTALSTQWNTLTIRSIMWHLCYAIENPSPDYLFIDKNKADMLLSMD